MKLYEANTLKAHMPRRRDRIESRAAFDSVRYANCWEDADILCTALAVRPGARILSIASAGDNALALLAEGAQVVAADLSLAQLACLELRVAAFRRLEYEELLAFLGVRPSADRRRTYAALNQRYRAQRSGFGMAACTTWSAASSTPADSRTTFACFAVAC